MFDYEISPGRSRKNDNPQEHITLGFTGLSEVSIPVSHIINHNLIVGRTGTGKSNLLASLWNIYSGIADANIVIFDPHGQLSDQIIAENKKMEVVYISTQEKYSVNGKRIGFNVLSRNGKNSGDIKIMINYVAYGNAYFRKPSET